MHSHRVDAMEMTTATGRPTRASLSHEYTNATLRVLTSLKLCIVSPLLSHWLVAEPREQLCCAWRVEKVLCLRFAGMHLEPAVLDRDLHQGLVVFWPELKTLAWAAPSAAASW